MSCPPILETLVRTDLKNVNVPANFQHPAAGVIEVNPKVYGNLGTYYFVIRACVDVDGGITAPICANSPEFAVQITDPCTSTELITAPITTMMRQPILQTESLSMTFEMGNGWPWIDTIDADISNSIYGSGLCGQIEYAVRTSDNQLTDLVFFDPVTERLEFAPQLSHQPGVYTLKFRAYMFNYQWITDYVFFDVEVLACQTDIYSDFVFIPDVSRIWYESEGSLNIGAALDSYYQEPNCQYPIEYTVSRLVGNTLVPLPSEVTVGGNLVTYSKCWGPGSVDMFSPEYDPECEGTIPYEKMFTLVVEAVVVGAPTATWNNNVNFNVLIEDPCAYDQISIPAETAIQDFTYYLSSNNAPYAMYPVVNHRYPECPMFCNLYQDFFGFEMDYPWDIVWYW